jgi:transposase
MKNNNMAYAGIDTGKRKLDVAITSLEEQLQVENTESGHEVLTAWLRKHRVERVGIEATGGYEQGIVRHLRKQGFVVVVFQPIQVRAYATFRGQLAKNDKIDAALIAECTADVKEIHAPADPRLEPFAQQMTLIEQIVEDIARNKTRRECCRNKQIQQYWKEEITRLERRKRAELKALAGEIRKHEDLGKRLDLIVSVDGIGLLTAVAILVRLPEIGTVTREKIAALAGVAPYDNQSSEQVRERHIRGGRGRLRKSLFCAALPASFRWNRQLIEIYRRLKAAGKSHKAALIACVRKLLIFANTVVARGTPWQKQQPRAKADLGLQAT